MIDQRLSHPIVELSSRLVLLYIKTSKKNVGSEKFGLEKFDDAVHDPLDLASSAPSGHTAPIKIPATPQMVPSSAVREISQWVVPIKIPAPGKRYPSSAVREISQWAGFGWTS